VKLLPQFQIGGTPAPRVKRQVPHTCPGDQPVLTVTAWAKSQPMPELIYCEPLQRVSAVILPVVLPADLVTRCIQIGGIGNWMSWASLAKRWGVWAVFADERWAESQSVLGGTRPRGWKFQFLN